MNIIVINIFIVIWKRPYNQASFWRCDQSFFFSFFLFYNVRYGYLRLAYTKISVWYFLIYALQSFQLCYWKISVMILLLPIFIYYLYPWNNLIRIAVLIHSYTVLIQFLYSSFIYMKYSYLHWNYRKYFISF